MAASTMLLAVLPALLCVGLCLRPAFFDGGIGELGISSDGGRLGPVVLFGAAVFVPVFLWLLWRDHGVATRVGMMMTAIAAVWGAHRLAGIAGALSAVAACGACALSAPGSLWAFNALTLCAGIGAAHLLCSLIATRSALARALVAVAVFDCVWIGTGIGGQTVALLPGVFEAATTSSPQPAVYNRILIGSDLLGSGDIFYAAVMAALLVRVGITRPELCRVGVFYVAAAAAMFAFSWTYETAIPATVPGLAALIIFCARRRHTGRGPWPRALAPAPQSSRKIGPAARAACSVGP